MQSEELRPLAILSHTGMGQQEESHYSSEDHLFINIGIMPYALWGSVVRCTHLNQFNEPLLTRQVIQVYPSVEKRQILWVPV